MLDCLVVGAGHSGLMCGFLLSRAQLNYLVVDSVNRGGDVWRDRPRNLKLFTSRQFCRLADMEMDGDQHGFPSGLEFADFLGRFAQQKQIRMQLGRSVTRLSESGGIFTAEMADGTYIMSKTVINATGSNQLPITPDFAEKLADSVQQVLAPAFRDAGDINTAGTVVIVGDGASGRQIARELAPTHAVMLARGRRRKLIPNQVLGRDVFWWLSRIGLLFASRDSVIAKILRKRDPIPCASANDTQLAGLGVTLKPRACGVQNNEILFADGTRQRASTVIWCGGYRENLSWIDLPAIAASGVSAFAWGMTEQPGYFVVGRKWLTCRASELVLGIEKDARLVVGLAKRHLATPLTDSSPRLSKSDPAC